jgi:tetratricopeptide (TPR) repeat protein
MLLAGALLIGCATPPDGAAPRADTSEAPSPNAYFFYTEAQILRAQGEYQEALVRMQKAMELDPGSRLLQRETAVLYLQLKDEEAALDTLEKLIAAHPDDIQALNLLGRIFQRRKQTEDAKRVYARILEQDPDNEDIYLLLGNLYMADAQWDQAFEVFTQFVQRFPNAYAGHFFLGRIYRAQNESLAAEKAFQRALQIEPELEGARFELIDLYTTDLKTGNYPDKVVELYEALLKDNPQNLRAIFGYALFERDRGRQTAAYQILSANTAEIEQNGLIREIFRHYIESEKFQEAVYLLDQLIDLHPDYEDLHYLKGLAHDGLKQYDQALAAFKKVTPQSRFYREATIQIAFRHAEDERHDLAIAHLEKALAQDPDNTEFLIYLGSFNEETQNYTAAEGYLLKATELAPDNERALFRLGVVYDKMERKDDSIAVMRRVIEINPEHANALNYLGYTYADLGINLDEAEDLVRRALKLRPDDGYITDSLGWVFYQQGNYEEALKWLLKAATLVPDDPIILEHVGDAYRRLGDRNQALRYYQKSLSLRKEDSERDKILPKIEALENEQP